MNSILKRTWAEISLDAVAQNFSAIRERLDTASGRHIRVMAMVKADAYGHGAPVIARTLEAAGADFFGVSSIDEAMQLRNAGIKASILITGYTPPEFMKTAIENGVSLTVYSLACAKSISAAAASLGKTAKIHIKVDTGMNRLGFLAESATERDASVEAIRSVSALPDIQIEGIYTHFSDADGDGEDYTRLQFSRFSEVFTRLSEAGVKLGLRHCLNSAGVLRFPEYALDMARPGLILYGLSPLSREQTPIKLTPIMVLKAAVSQIKTVAAGEPVSYGRSELLSRDSRLAVLPVGYADGLLRSLSGKWKVSVGGVEARIVGRICMDQCICDITDVPDVFEGDEAVIFGDGNDTAPIVDMLASVANTVSYEICCVIGKRVPRLYFENNRLVGRLNYILDRF